MKFEEIDFYDYKIRMCLVIMVFECTLSLISCGSTTRSTEQTSDLLITYETNKPKN